MTGPATLITKSFVNLTDPRADRGHNHNLDEMIFITLTAAICGANGWAVVERFAKAKRQWFERYLKLEEGIPSHDTLGRVFARLDTGEFLTAMHAWVDRFAGSLREKGVAIDGKVLRGSFDRAAGQDPLHTITAFATEARLVLRMSRHLRDHWKIENSEAYILDVTFAEDASRIRSGNGPEISAAFRRMALNILQQDTTLKDSIRGKRLCLGWDEAALDKLYAGFNGI